MAQYHVPLLVKRLVEITDLFVALVKSFVAVSAPVLTSASLNLSRRRGWPQFVSVEEAIVGVASNENLAVSPT